MNEIDLNNFAEEKLKKVFSSGNPIVIPVENIDTNTLDKISEINYAAEVAAKMRRDSNER